MTRSILILDDHAVCREGLRFLLSREWPDAKLDCAESFDEAKTTFPKDNWNLAILDFDLRKDSGFTVISDLKAMSPGIEVLVFTEHPESQFGVRAFRAGAKGFLNKVEPASELFRAIQNLLDGKTYVSPRMEALLISALSDEGGGMTHAALSNR